MKIALVGYGKMGKMIESLAPQYGIEVGWRIDHGDSLDQIEGADAAIEFTVPSAVVGNLTKLAEMGVPTICGTTGWYEHLDEVKVMFKDGSLVYGTNFSVGVAVFRSVVAEAAKRFAKLSDYEAYSYEMHHSAKLDAPSGTLNTLVETMKEAGYERNIDQGWNRAGKVPGTHEIGFDGPADTITLRHVARSREGFARGALIASKWISKNKGVYEFAEIVDRLGEA